MLSFPPHPDCKLCKLHAHATNPGLPSRAFVATGQKRALLFVGEAPGENEDRNKRIWCGWSGTLLEKFINSTQVHQQVDIYLTNACRCRPPQNATPTKGQIKTCRTYLLSDLGTLLDTYSEVILFCLGAIAAHSVYDANLSESFSFGQGETVENFPGKPRVFFTYHPALLHPRRRPQLLYAVRDHWNLLLQYIKDGELPRDNLVVTPILNLKPPQQEPL